MRRKGSNVDKGLFPAADAIEPGMPLGRATNAGLVVTTLIMFAGAALLIYGLATGQGG